MRPGVCHCNNFVFASNRMLKYAVDVYAQAKKFGLQPSVRECNFLLKHLAEANDRAFFVAFFDEIKNSRPFLSVYTFIIVIYFYSSGTKPISSRTAPQST
ncbi:hypothetical protein ACJIZ3_019282 [Penstemon smallii]|uniref:Uncharacterized protein n=1 Tax=Penstemon smallii TaxID=265156 RepID=A0ABD3T0S5_9LAMI